MCTLSWLPAEGGYHLFFNRDELRTRQRAHPPAVHHLDGVACLYPIDADAGGTWLGVSARGLTVALLNYYPDDYRLPDANPRSRGQVIPGVLTSAGAHAAIERAAAMPLDAYPPFMLAALAPGEPLVVATWNGRVFQRADPAPPVLSTSSFAAAAVVASRLQSFARRRDAAGGVTPAVLAACHASHDPARGPFSICMHREDACTVSHSHIEVEATSIRFHYTDGTPCETVAGEALTLGRTT